MEPFTSESKCFTMWRSKNSSSSSSPSGASSPPASGADWQDWWKSSAGQREGRDGEVLVGATMRAVEELRYRWGPGTRRQCVSPCRGREPCGAKWHEWATSQLSQGCCLPAAAKGEKSDGWPCENLVFPSLTQCQKLLHLKLFVETKAKSSLYPYCIYLYVCIYIYFKKHVSILFFVPVCVWTG